MSDGRAFGPRFHDDRAIRTLLQALREDPRLGSGPFHGDEVLLVFDELADRLIYASGSASPLRSALAEPDGRPCSAIRLADQIRKLTLTDDHPILARLILDRRGLAAPVTTMLLRARLGDGTPVIVLSPQGPLPRLRPLRSPGPSPVPGHGAETGRADCEVRPQRFVWRTDAQGRLMEISGPFASPLRGVMAGRTWAKLSEAGVVVDAGGLLSAVAAGRTFRAIPLVLKIGGRDLDLDVSGAPLDRTSGAFGGFGLVRPQTAPRPVADLPVSPTAVPGLNAPDGSLLGETSDALPIGGAEETEVLGKPDAVGEPDEGWAAGPAVSSDEPTAPADLPPLEEPALPGAPVADPSLSSHEHAAFREIARALGARFAADEADTAPEPTSRACAVMPFPLSPRASESAIPVSDDGVVATLERIPTGVLVYRDETVLFANTAFLDLTGFRDLAGLRAAGGVTNLFRGLVPHERSAGDHPVALSTRDGAPLGVTLERSGLDWGGLPAELLLVRDATPGEADRRLAAEALVRDHGDRRALDALRVLDAIEDGIATLDANARILGLNRSAAHIFGLDPREVVGSPFLRLFVPESAIAVLAGLHAAPGEAEPRVVLARNGGTLRFKVFSLEGGDEGRICAVIRRTSAETGIVPVTRSVDEAASDQISDFLAKVSHEIRTPITGIVGLADLMRSERFGPLGTERYRAYLDDIHASGSHVLDLVGDLLDLARIEAGRMDLTATAIPLNEIVSRCVALLQPEAARERIVVRTSFSSDLATFMADERCVRQATLNVLTNAIAFTAPGGQVIVSTTMADRGEVALRVRDTGAGMSPAEVETALQPFRQVDVSGPRKGTGLGLPLTKALVEANHGRFRISSRETEGTLVEILFPSDPQSKRA